MLKPSEIIEESNKLERHTPGVRFKSLLVFAALGGVYAAFAAPKAFLEETGKRWADPPVVTPPHDGRGVVRTVPEATKPAPEATKPAPEATKPAPEATKPAPRAVKMVPQARKIVPEAPKITFADLDALLVENMKSLQDSALVKRWEGENRPSVGILPIQNETGEAIDDRLSALLSEIETNFVNAGHIRVLTGWNDTKRAPGAERLVPRYLVSTRVQAFDGHRERGLSKPYALVMRVVDDDTGDVLWQARADLTKLPSGVAGAAGAGPDVNGQ